MRKLWAALAAGLSALVFGGTPSLADGRGYTDVPIDRVKAEVEGRKALLVDVREEIEWERGHLRDAAFVPLSKLNKWNRAGLTDADRAELEKLLPKGSVVYCHCAAGSRCLPAGQILKKLGYDARPLRDGYQSLVKAGFPKSTDK